MNPKCVAQKCAIYCLDLRSAVLIVGRAAELGVETFSRMNTRHLDYGGTRAIIALTDNGNPIITGYEISADKPSVAYPSAESRPSPPLERKETIIAALKESMAQRGGERKGVDFDTPELYTGSAAE